MCSDQQALNLRAVLVFFFMLTLGSFPSQTTHATQSGGGSDPNNEGQRQGAPCSRVDGRARSERLRARCPSGSSGGVARGDFNGDGFADLAVGSPGEDIGAADGAGSVTVIHGSVTGLRLTESATVPAPLLLHQNVLGVAEVSETGDGFGGALASGNFDGDQFSDLAVGVPGENGSGAVHVFRGSAGGLTTVGDVVLSFGSVGLASEASARLGAALVWGDFDGDGVGDLAVGAPDADHSNLGGSSVINAGLLVVLFGTRDVGLTGSRFQIVHMGTLGIRPDQSDRFGKVLAAGSFNGDAADELVVGSPDDRLQGGASVIVIEGSGTGLNTSRLRIFRGNGDGLDLSEVSGLFFGASSFGSALAVGDFNGDGGLDLAVGIPKRSIATSSGGFPPSLEEVGSVQVLFNNNQADPFDRGLTTAGTLLIQQGRSGIADARERLDHFGAALAAGRFNDDGFADLAIGVPDEDFDGAADGGAVHVIYGSSTGPSATAGPGTRFFHQESAGIPGTSEPADRFGASLSAWNFGRDAQFVPGPCEGCIHTARLADLVIGIPGESLLNAGGVNTTDAGRLVVVYGTVTDGVTTANGGLQEFSQAVAGVPSEGGVEQGDKFGAAVY